jgi:D-glycero-alpha-D-manno-heptose-7-phosphate kinase
VVSFALQRHAIAIVRPSLSGTWQFTDHEVETAAHPGRLAHPFVRGVLAEFEAQPLSIELIHSVPTGSGLGTSASAIVAMLASIGDELGIHASATDLARRACKVEMETLGRPVGRQDPYGAAVGGVKLIEFFPDETVHVRPLQIAPAARQLLEESCLLFFSGQTRPAEQVLAHIGEDSSTDTRSIMVLLRDLAYRTARTLESSFCLEELGALLDEGWALKRCLHPAITTPLVDRWHAAARRCGAVGARLLGAGSGGFFLVLAPVERHDSIRAALEFPPELPVRIDERGVQTEVDGWDHHVVHAAIESADLLSPK